MKRSKRRKRLMITLLTFLILLVLLTSLGACIHPYAWRTAKRNFLQPTPYYRAANRPAPASWSDEEITATWIGHSTVLLNIYGTTVLTDPMLVERLGANPFGHYNVGIRRTSEPALRFKDLPPIDLVLLSHAHRDHWDLASLKYFDEKTTAVIPANTSDLLPDGRFGQVTELRWGEETRLGDLTIRAFAVNHWGERNGRGDEKERGYNGYLLAKRGRHVLFMGDTAYIPNHEMPFVPAPPDLVLLPIGAYYPYIRAHASPEQAWAMFRATGGRQLLAHHWRTFILSQEPILEPMERLLKAAEAEENKIVCREPGEVVVVTER